ncbi:hypothetical protein [Isoptericola sp. NPDC058082]|uniref:hypothetical protein n=1 Tax=Isoptericola sp. NPDC058082 TaxID=3346331 RepID=UPI0036E9EA4B
MRRTGTAGVVLLALTVAGSVSACTDDDAGAATLAELQASASAGPGLDPEEQAEQKAIDDATGVLDDFRALEAEVANDGYGGWTRLTMDYWGGELAEAYAPWYRDMAEKGWYTTGAAEMVDSEVTGYTARGAGYEKIEFTTCLDTSGLRMHEKDGTEVPLPNDTAERYVNVYELEHQGKDGAWRVTDSTGQMERSC